jgi:peptidyl-prolyl cis-trans isomerase A (cyclophilin A)
MYDNKSNRSLYLFIAGIIALCAVIGGIVFLSHQKSDDTATDPSSSQAASTSSSSEESLTKEQLNALALPQLKANTSRPTAVMSTTAGDITIEFFPEYAPKAVENFLTHAQDGYYDGGEFFRVIKDFMVQSGDPDNDGTGGASIWGTDFENEIAPELYNIRGAVSMANAGADTNSSQWFINQNTQDVTSQLDASKYPDKIVDAYKKGGNPSLDGSYTVFGQVVKGMDVVDKIATAKVERNAGTGEDSKPVDPVTIKSIKVTNYTFKEKADK